MKKIGAFIVKFNAKFSCLQRIILIVVLVLVVGLFILLPILGLKSNNNIEDDNLRVDKNVYMYEEIVFSDEIYLKCIGINATKDEEVYSLNLTININQWNTDMYINKQAIKSEYFTIKQVDINAKSAMSVFLGNVVKATLATSLEAAMTGEINVLESVASFAEDYTTDTIENASTKKGKKIKASKDQFEPFKPSDSLGVTTTVTVSFDIPKDVYESDYVLVLSLDAGFKFEKNIFLMLRPNMKQYDVSYDANDDELGVVKVITYEPGIIYDFPNIDLDKEGYRFVYWTKQKNNKETRIRDIYFYTNKEDHSFTLFAYYEKVINVKEVININESIYLKNNTYNIFISDINIVDSHLVKDKKGNETKRITSINNQLLLVDITILKEKDGAKHKLNN